MSNSETESKIEERASQRRSHSTQRVYHRLTTTQVGKIRAKVKFKRREVCHRKESDSHIHLTGPRDGGVGIYVEPGTNSLACDHFDGAGDKVLQSQSTAISIAQTIPRPEQIDRQPDVRQSLILRSSTSGGDIHSTYNNDIEVTTSTGNSKRKAQSHGQDGDNSMCHHLPGIDKVWAQACVDCSQRLVGFPEQPATSLPEHSDVDCIFGQESLDLTWLDFLPDLTGTGINRSHDLESFGNNLVAPAQENTLAMANNSTLQEKCIHDLSQQDPHQGTPLAGLVTSSTVPTALDNASCMCDGPGRPPNQSLLGRSYIVKHGYPTPLYPEQDSITLPRDFSNSSMAERIEHVMEAATLAGFEDLDTAVESYYTASFCDSSTISSNQSLSRSRRLPRLLASIKSSVQNWSERESRAFREELLLCAERILLDECSSFRRSQQSRGPYEPLASGDVLHGARDTETPSVESGNRKLREELPNLWSLLSTLSCSDQQDCQNLVFNALAALSHANIVPESVARFSA